MTGVQNKTNCPEGTAEPLPKLSSAEFRMYNRMAEHMDAFVSRAGSAVANKIFCREYLLDINTNQIPA